jgi:chloramphenicol 3-O phosphotransferase
MPKCIILNGASSSGKTSICKELQILMPELAHLQIDNIASLYFSCFSEDYDHTAEWSKKRYKRQIAIRRMLTGLALILLEQGFDVCIDTGFDGPYADEHMQYYLTKLHHYFPVLIGVMCNLSILEERERQRGDRELGLARKQLEEGIHQNRPYAFTVNTTNNPSKECAKLIFERI